MTPEEKAKAYDEAIAKAQKELQSCGSKDCDAARQIYRFFPELSESEDERIRKSIIAIINNYVDNSNTFKPKMIAWLEKQAEQKPTYTVKPKFKVGDTVTVKPMSCHDKVFKGEPFKIVDIIEDNYVSDDGKAYSISLQDGWELVEQKSSWSEEDEKTLNEIFSVAARASLRKSTLFGISYDYIKWQNWLKSIRNRITWKPTKEQMRALNDINLTGDISYAGQGQTLIELYNDLKKLKGE